MIDARVDYDPFFLSPGDADRLLDACLSTIQWEQHVIRLYGKEHPCPRLSAWYGDQGMQYTYSGLTLTPLPWNEVLWDIRERLREHSGTIFNTVLANLYRNGTDSMGWHSDNEPELGPEPEIASLSLGASRRFVMKHKKKKAEPQVFELTHGSLLIMAGPTQHYWKHAVPKTARECGQRVNLTFRTIV